MPDLSFDLADFLGDPVPPYIPAVGVSETDIDFFGVDILFTDDLQITASGDYALVGGWEALQQAIRIRLITSPGEYAIYPDFGCGLRQFVKKRASQSERDTLRQRIIDQLSQEERIEKVIEVTLTSFASNNMTGIKIFVRVTALGQEIGFKFTTFAE